eukprot:NODE_4969_length_328_cov_100.003584_g4358_i0.p1 GENE.NODE_4969_length_328_cov_100.003584_g4358_i0~~NODE_4969_length_328_cov_100.003584_g4358_i0.p1  ORF type:complete len:100 (-),score=26.94 NODE_4969_length_328_cov_100.003584_g4358_i0:27-305(-)
MGVGMRHFHLKKNPRHCPVINLDQVAAMVPENERLSCKGTDKVPIVDIVKKGYFKLLGKGVPRFPMIVKTRLTSRIAEKKLKKAKGAVVLRA